MTKVLISLPDDVKRRVDRMAKITHRSRSAFIRHMLEEQLNMIRPRRTPEELEAMIAEVRRAVGRYQAGKVIRHFRDTRGRF